MQILKFISITLFAMGVPILVSGSCYFVDNGKRTSLACMILGLLMTYGGFMGLVYLATTGGMR